MDGMGHGCFGESFCYVPRFSGIHVENHHPFKAPQTGLFCQNVVEGLPHGQGMDLYGWPSTFANALSNGSNWIHCTDRGVEDANHSK